MQNKSFQVHPEEPLNYNSRLRYVKHLLRNRKLWLLRKLSCKKKYVVLFSNNKLHAPPCQRMDCGLRSASKRGLHLHLQHNCVINSCAADFSIGTRMIDRNTILTTRIISL